MKACRNALAAAAARPINCWKWALVVPALPGQLPGPPTWIDSALVSWEGPLNASADRMHSSSTTASARRSSRCSTCQAGAADNYLAGRIKSVQAGL